MYIKFVIFLILSSSFANLVNVKRINVKHSTTREKLEGKKELFPGRKTDEGPNVVEVEPIVDNSTIDIDNPTEGDDTYEYYTEESAIVPVIDNSTIDSEVSKGDKTNDDDSNESSTDSEVSEGDKRNDDDSNESAIVDNSTIVSEPSVGVETYDNLNESSITDNLTIDSESAEGDERNDDNSNESSIVPDSTDDTNNGSIGEPVRDKDHSTSVGRDRTTIISVAPSKGLKTNVLRTLELGRDVNSVQYNAKVGQFPWLVAFKTFNLNEDAIDVPVVCGGTIIAPTWVMTVALCLTPNTPPSKYHVIAGATSISDDVIELERDVPALGVQVRKVKRVFRHPRFMNSTTHYSWVATTEQEFWFNVGLVFLSSPFDIQAGPAVRAIARASMLTPSFARSCFIFGWGEKLLLTGDNLQDKFMFKGRLRYKLVTARPYLQCVDGANKTVPYQVCVWRTPTPSFPCSGDDGGPLVCNVTGTDTSELELLGMSSRNTEGLFCSNSSNYVFVGAFSEWIEQTLLLDERSVPSHFERSVPDHVFINRASEPYAEKVYCTVAIVLLLTEKNK